jgi:hypothetical protein
MPARVDHWWQVAANADVAAIQADVEKTILESGLPWLETRSDLQRLAAYYRAFAPRAAAHCYVLAGERSLARACLLEWMTDTVLSEEARARARAWAAAVGVEL